MNEILYDILHRYIIYCQNLQVKLDYRMLNVRQAMGG